MSATTTVAVPTKSRGERSHEDTPTLCALFEPQAGDWESEGQQRLVSLTAQVTAQAAQLAAAEQRCKELLVSQLHGTLLVNDKTEWLPVAVPLMLHPFI
jgi:hypothetical protein